MSSKFQIGDIIQLQIHEWTMIQTEQGRKLYPGINKRGPYIVEQFDKVFNCFTQISGINVSISTSRFELIYPNINTLPESIKELMNE